jgi:purine-binding chemotaxis protein CheW
MAEKEMQMVVFQLNSRETATEYGVPITQVQEINRVTSPTKLPQAPDFVEGVINLRGKVIPLIDLKKRFGMEKSEYTEETRIVVVDIAGQTVGVVVDQVTEVLRLPESGIEPPPTMITGVAADYLTGVGKLDNRLLVLLDLGRILTGSETEALIGAVS